jgi:hypothetical protein
LKKEVEQSASFFFVYLYVEVYPVVLWGDKKSGATIKDEPDVS